MQRNAADPNFIPPGARTLSAELQKVPGLVIGALKSDLVAVGAGFRF